MIASQLLLDRPAIQALNLKTEYDLHKLVYSMFPGNRRSFLYYDLGGDIRGKALLLLSAKQPILPKAGELQSKPVPEDFLGYTRYAFQVLLNPVVRKSGKSTFIPVIGREDLVDWFLRRSKDWGFSVDSSRLEISDTGVIRICKQNTTIIYNKACFSGVLEVEDIDRFTDSFEKGIGRGKAFGFGLLQIRPINSKEGDKR